MSFRITRQSEPYSPSSPLAAVGTLSSPPAHGASFRERAVTGGSSSSSAAAAQRVPTPPRTTRELNANPIASDAIPDVTVEVHRAGGAGGGTSPGRHRNINAAAARVDQLRHQLSKSDRELIAEYNANAAAARRAAAPQGFVTELDPGSQEQPLVTSPSGAAATRSRAATANPFARSGPPLGILPAVSGPAPPRPSTTEPGARPLPPSSLRPFAPSARRTLSPIAGGPSAGTSAILPTVMMNPGNAPPSDPRPSSATPSPFGTKAFLTSASPAAPPSRPTSSRMSALPPIEPGAGTVAANPHPNASVTSTMLESTTMRTRTFSASAVGNESFGSAASRSTTTTTTAARPPGSPLGNHHHHHAPIVEASSPHLSKRQQALLQYYTDRCRAHGVPVNSGVMFVLSTAVASDDVVQDDHGYFYEARAAAGIDDEAVDDADAGPVPEINFEEPSGAEGFEVVHPLPEGEFDDCRDIEADAEAASRREPKSPQTPRRIPSSGGLLQPKRSTSFTLANGADGSGGGGWRQSSTASYAFSTPSNSTLFFSSPASSSAQFSSFAFVQDANFSMNCLGPKGVLPLFDVLRRCPNLSRLSLRGNNLDSQSICTLVNEVLTVMAKDPDTRKPRRRLMRHRHLRYLDLGDNPIGMLAGKALAMMLDIGKNDLHNASGGAASDDSPKRLHRGQEHIDEHFLCRIEEIDVSATLINAALRKRLENRALANKLLAEGGALDGRPWPELLAEDTAEANVEQRGEAELEKAKVLAAAAAKMAAEAAKRDAVAPIAALPKVSPQRAPPSQTPAQPRPATGGFVLFWEIIF